jgi:hypothetical protein
VECRCDDPAVQRLDGDAALAYAQHLDRVTEDDGQWLLRCSDTGSEWVEDFPLDPRNREWVGVCRLRRFPPKPA